VLASLGFGFDAQGAQTAAMYIVAGLTLLSIGFYVREWVRHMNEVESGTG
jgi:cardiolipin synthase